MLPQPVKFFRNKDKEFSIFIFNLLNSSITRRKENDSSPNETSQAVQCAVCMLPRNTATARSESLQSEGRKHDISPFIRVISAHRGSAELNFFYTKTTRS